MDNKIVSTTYVPLQPPYQIIKYSGDIAMQIGTLIVTIQKEGSVNGLGYQIETHSHPVVSYENKFKMEPNHQLSSYQFLEGAVWNSVEVKDVTTICLSNSRLSWQDFVEFLWRDMGKKMCIAQPTNGAYWSLEKLCGGVELPVIQNYEVHLQTDIHYKDHSNTPVVRSGYGDVFALNANAVDKDVMKLKIIDQISGYVMILQSVKGWSDEKLTISYTTNEEVLQPLVDGLNQNRRFTTPLAPPRSAGIGTLSFFKNKETTIKEDE